MARNMNRREFLKAAGLAGAGAVVVATGIACNTRMTETLDPKATGGFLFAQLSDLHWGFNDPAINPDFAGTLNKAIAAVNAWDAQPDFAVFTGDLTETTDDDKLRRQRMVQVKQMIKALKVREVRFLPGEHDAALDGGAAFQEVFGPTHYVFEHKGVHFIALDNVSDPHGALGRSQLDWLAGELKKLDKDSRIVVLTHRPLFDLAADWDWTTADGQAAIDLLKACSNVVVLYGHIHQVHNHTTGQIEHHSAMGLMWPLPAPRSAPRKAPVPWDPAHPYKGLGYRSVTARLSPARYELADFEVKDAPAAPAEITIKVTAKQFEFSPSEITVTKGQPVLLELTSLDVRHGLNCPGLGIRADINPHQVTQLRFTPKKAGKFPFHCDVFCGIGHGTMTGTIIVKE